MLLPAIALACLSGGLAGTAETATEPPVPLLNSTSDRCSLQSRGVLCSVTATTSAAKVAKVAKDTSVPTPSSSASLPAHDVVAGAMARAASQGTIHPLDTLKVRLQAYKRGAEPGPTPSTSTSSSVSAIHRPRIERAFMELASLYKGVVGAATGAGIIIGAYFALYSTTKRFLRERTTMQDGSITFVAGATAAVGSTFVKVPIAVCIRSVQAGVYKNVFHAYTSIRTAAGTRGLFTGFLPTLLEDVPDMAVKFTVYETLRAVYTRLHDGQQPGTAIDLLMGGTAGAAAAAATTPLDVVKTRMMCSASSRPTIVQAVHGVLAEGGNYAAFFRGVGPRALSNGLNSAIFFCCFEAIRRVLHTKQQEQELLHALTNPITADATTGTAPAQVATRTDTAAAQQQLGPVTPAVPFMLKAPRGIQQARGLKGSERMACLSLALPMHTVHQRQKHAV